MHTGLPSYVFIKRPHVEPETVDALVATQDLLVVCLTLCFQRTDKEDIRCVVNSFETRVPRILFGDL